MKIFLAHSSNDIKKVNKFIDSFLDKSNNEYILLNERNHSVLWQDNVKNKIKKSSLVLFFIGNSTYKSEPLKWEFELAKSLNRTVLLVDIRTNKSNTPKYLKNSKLISSPKELIKKINIMQKDKRNLLIEQYKIMVSSTEKVTEQRLKVNNLFFTVTTSLLSISILLGKSFGFSLVAMLGMIVLSVLSILVTYFWNKLINSYGQLNTGKFELITEIENELNTEMFQREWEILTEKIKYEPNTKTESKIIMMFRVFIWILLAIEIAYLVYLLISKYCCC